MRVIETPIPGVLVLEPKVFGDARGFFFESWNARVFREATGIETDFVQDNHSRSAQGVLRGLHYQVQKVPPTLPSVAAPQGGAVAALGLPSSGGPQGKLVRVVRGAVFDVAVDLRRSSPAFGRWFGAELTEENHRQMWVPPGCAHGFVVLSEFADFLYKATDYYATEQERCIRWNDPAIGIDWGVSEPLLSAKDSQGVAFAEAETYA